MKSNRIMLVFQLKSVPLQTEVFLLQREVRKRGYFPSDITLYNKVEYIRLMYMNQTRAKARTFMAHICNCIIINRHNDYAGLENMS